MILPKIDLILFTSLALTTGVIGAMEQEAPHQITLHCQFPLQSEKNVNEYILTPKQILTMDNPLLEIIIPGPNIYNPNTFTIITKNNEDIYIKSSSSENEKITISNSTQKLATLYAIQEELMIKEKKEDTLILHHNIPSSYPGQLCYHYKNGNPSEKIIVEAEKPINVPLNNNIPLIIKLRKTMGYNPRKIKIDTQDHTDIFINYLSSGKVNIKSPTQKLITLYPTSTIDNSDTSKSTTD